MQKILNALDNDGLYIFDQLIAPELLNEIENYARTAEAKLSPPLASSRTRAVFDPLTPLASGYFFDARELMQQSVLQKFLGDPLLLTLARSYFGVEPKVRELVLWWSTVFSRNPSSDMAQLFHHDLSHMKWLKFFVYLTDVTATTGPHSYVLGSHKPDTEGKEIRTRGVVRVSDEDIHHKYPREKIIDVMGPRGTAFIADTRGFHKGNHPITDHRLILQVYLVNSLYPDTKKKNKKLDLFVTDRALAESIRCHPKTFAGYNIRKQK